VLKFYGYSKCSTCIKARKILKQSGVDFEDIDITVTPPSSKLLKDILNAGVYPLKKLFNTSGVVYRELKIKDKLANMSEAEAIDLLASEGKLIKRPIISNGKAYVVGFNEEVINALC
jgi:arsenate reductase